MNSYVITTRLKETNGTRFFVTPIKLECAGKRLMEQIRLDMLQYMTVEAANAILVDYKEYQQKAQTTPVWKPTWFEKQIITTQNTEDQELQGKRKKTVVETNESTQKQELIKTHMAHKQHATKVLSEAAMTNEERRLAVLEHYVAELQMNNVDVKTIMSEIK
jgi:hypothetical protein